MHKIVFLLERTISRVYCPFLWCLFWLPGYLCRYILFQWPETVAVRDPIHQTPQWWVHFLFTKLQLPGTNSLFLSAMVPVSSFKSSLKTSFRNLFLSPIALSYECGVRIESSFFLYQSHWEGSFLKMKQKNDKNVLTRKNNSINITNHWGDLNCFYIGLSPSVFFFFFLGTT